MLEMSNKADFILGFKGISFKEWIMYYHKLRKYSVPLILVRF